MSEYRASAGIERLRERAERLGLPMSVLFQLTDKCNYRCAHCYEVHEDRNELRLDEIQRILGELAQAGVLFLTLTGGEPFMRRDIDDILVSARQHRFAVRLYTTGHFIDDARADRLAELAIQEVHLSLYGGDAASHEAITLMPGSFERTVAAARRLRKRGLGVIIKSPVMTVNVRRYRELIDLIEGLGCTYSLDPKVTPREDGDRSPLHLRPSDTDLAEFYSTFRDLEAATQWREQALAPAANLDGSSCSIGQSSVSINPQGKVFGCVALPIPVGDLREQSFASVWKESAKLQELRSIRWRDIPICRDCTVRPFCSRCHATALLEDGKLLGPSLEACRHAVATREGLRLRGKIGPDELTELPVPLREGAQNEAPVKQRPVLAYGFRSAALRIID